MQKDIVHTRVVSTLLIVICIVVSAGLSGYFLDIYTTNAEAINEAPYADAGESIVFGYRGAPITFDGSGSNDTDGEIISYKWDFGNGFSGIGIKPTHTYNIVGNYTVTLTVTDNDGASSNASITARILDDASGTGLYTKVNVNDIIMNGTSLQGSLVMVQEVVVSDAGSYNSGYGTNPTGWVKFYVKDSSTTAALDIYCDGGATRPTDLSNGDIVTVTGIVELYNSVWEIKVRKDTTDKVVLVSGGSGDGTQYTQATVNQIFTDFLTYNNSNICILGAVVTDYYVGSSWKKVTVRDNSTTATMIIFGFEGANITAASAGDYVDVYGHLEWYQPATGNGYPEIMIREGTDDRVALASSGGGFVGNYTRATVNQILTDSATYNNSLVCVLSALVVDYYAPSYKKVTVRDNSTTSNLVAFGFDGADIAAISIGDYVDVYGHLEWYQPNTGNGYFEIIIRENTDDRIVISSEGGDGEASNLTPIDELHENFDSVQDYTDIDFAGWTNFAEEGNRRWQGKTYSGNGYAQATGYNSGLASMICWLITPPINMSAEKVLTFKTAKAYWTHGTNPGLTVWASTDYDGANVTSATWTTIDARLAQESDPDNDWIASGDISLSPYMNESYVFIAFKYAGSNTLSTSFRIEDLHIENTTGGGGTGDDTDYTVATVNQLLTASSLNNTDVAVLGALVTDYYKGSTFKKITITDNSTTSTLVVFGYDDSPIIAVSVGDYINAYGHLEWYQPISGNGYFELMVRKGTDDRVEVVSGGGGGDGTVNGTGTKEDPYDVASAIILQKSATPYNSGWVRGYIVGSVKSGKTSVSSASDIDWVSPFSSNTNVVIADDLMESNYLNCAVVSLPSGSALRTTVNLLDNPGNDGKTINVLGSFRSYFGIAGVRDCPGNVTDFELTGVGGGGWDGGTTDYTLATVHELLTDSSLNNTDVCVLGALVTDYYVGSSYTKVTITDNSTTGTVVAFGFTGADIEVTSAGDYVNAYGHLEWYQPTSGSGYFEIMIRKDTDDRLAIASSGGGGGGGGDGNGTKTDPYDVATVIARQNESPYLTGWVEGFIVGSVKTGVLSISSSSDIHWTGPFTSSTNVVIADSSTENNYLNCAVVNLPSGTALRTDVNLVDHPDNLGKTLNVLGTFRSYFGIAGVRDCPGNATDFELTDGGGGGGGDDPEPGNYTTVTARSLLLNPATYLGTRVHIADAMVTDAYSYNFGYGESPGDMVMFYVSDASTTQSLLVYCEANAARPTSLSDGDYVEVYAYLDQHLGQLELVIRYGTDDAVIPSEQSYRIVTVNQLLTDSSTYLGKKVAVLNALVSDAYSYNLGSGGDPANWVVFFIKDNSTTSALKVYCQAWANRPLELENGDEVNVYGILDLHFSTLELVIRNQTADMAEPTSGGYSIVTVDQLLSNPAAYLEKRVCVKAATIIDAFSYNGGYGSNPANTVYFYISDSSTALTILVSCEPNADRPLSLEDGDKVDVHAILESHYGTLEMLVRSGTDDSVAISASSGKLVYYCTGHGEATGDFTNFQSAVSSAGYLYMEGDINSIDLANVRVLVISNPNTQYTSGELLNIKNFVESGGTLLLLCESDKLEGGRPENLNPILAYLGMDGRFNDDEYLDDWYCYDMWDYSEYFPGIPYFNFVSYQNATPEYAELGCFVNDTTGITEHVQWLRGERMCTIYNTTNDVIVMRGSEMGYGLDNDPGSNEAWYYSNYPQGGGTRPPVLAANGSIGAGRVLYGGLTYTLSDSNTGGWDNSNITELVFGILKWASETTGSQSPTPESNAEDATQSQASLMPEIHGNATMMLTPRRSVY